MERSNELFIHLSRAIHIGRLLQYCVPYHNAILVRMLLHDSCIIKRLGK